MMESFETGSNCHDDLRHFGNNPVATFLPEKSSRLYQKQYELFSIWCKDKDMNMFTESTFLAYFLDKAKIVKSSTLWSTYSMLKSTFIIKHNVDASKFSELIRFLKQQNVGYTPKTTSIFSRDDLIKFLVEAPDINYLMLKVCFIFGVEGACRMDELKKITINDIEDHKTILTISLLDSQTGKRRRFTLTNDLAENIRPIDIYRKYRSLRPSHTPHKALFVFYRLGKCSTQPIGIHTFGRIPSLVATYLKLPEPNNYTGHAFRRSSALLCPGAGAGAGVPTLKQRGRRKYRSVADRAKDKTNATAPNTKQGTSIFCPIQYANLHNNYCRTCMGVLLKLNNLRDGSHDNLLQILHCILGFEITEECFNICLGCQAKLNSIMEFKSECLKTIAEFANLQSASPKEEPIEFNDPVDLDDSNFDLEITNSHLNNSSLDVEVDEITTKYLEDRTSSIESNCSNQLNKCGPTVSTLQFNQNQDIVECTENVLKQNLQMRRQFPKTDILEEISRRLNVLNNSEHMKCRLCNYIGRNVDALGCHMTSRHRNLSKTWCYQCNLITDNLLKHRETSKCLNFFCKFCNKFCGLINESISHLQSHNHEIHNIYENDLMTDNKFNIMSEQTLEQVYSIQACFIKDEPPDDSVEEDIFSTHKSEKEHIF